MNRSTLSIVLILCHLALSTAWAGTVTYGEMEKDHVHTGVESTTIHDLTEHADHGHASLEDLEAHHLDHHDHDDANHIHLTFQIHAPLTVTNLREASEQNALGDGHAINLQHAPPVPPPTA